MHPIYIYLIQFERRKHYHMYGLQVLLFYCIKMDPEVTQITTEELQCRAV